MSEISRISPSNPNKRRPNYAARRAGAVAVAALTLFGGAKVGATAVDEIKAKTQAEKTGVLPEGQPQTETYIVEPGDTLWEIARDRLGPDADVRPLLHSLRQQPDARNGLQPWDELIVPEKIDEDK